MVVVAAHRFQPLAPQPLGRLVVVDVGVGRLAPHHHAQPVAPVEEAGILDLLVDAHAVEAHRLGHLHLAPERVGGRGGEVGLGPVILRQDEAHEDRHVVEVDPPVAHLHRAHPVIAFDAVDDPAVSVRQDDLGLDEVGRVRRPVDEAARAHRAVEVEQDEAAQLPPGHLVIVVGQQLVVRPDQADVEPRALGHRAVQAHDHLHPELIEIGRPADLGDRRFRHRLQPHGLPDAGRPVVPDRLQLLAPILLAARLPEVDRIVLRAHDHDLLGPVVEHGGDVGGKGRVPALVAGHEPPVDPDLSAIIDRAEVEEEATAPVLGSDFEGPAVPDHRVEARVADAARLRFGRERDDDLPVEHALGWLGVEPALQNAAILVVVSERPGARQVRPARAAKRRPGVKLAGFAS